MTKHKKVYVEGLVDKLWEYADARELDLQNYSKWHYRLLDQGFTVLDIWTTGRYYVVDSDYAAKYPGADLVETAGQKGQLDMNNLWPFLDKLFFGEDMTPHTK